MSSCHKMMLLESLNIPFMVLSSFLTNRLVVLYVINTLILLPFLYWCFCPTRDGMSLDGLCGPLWTVWPSMNCFPLVISLALATVNGLC